MGLYVRYTSATHFLQPSDDTSHAIGWGIFSKGVKFYDLAQAAKGNWPLTFHEIVFILTMWRLGVR